MREQTDNSKYQSRRFRESTKSYKESRAMLNELVTDDDLQQFMQAFLQMSVSEQDFNWRTTRSVAYLVSYHFMVQCC